MRDDRRSRLLGVKLRALVGGHLAGVATPEFDQIEPRPFPSGAAIVHDGGAWVLVDGAAERSLGAALAWAIRHGADRLDLVVERDTGLVARRARRFGLPTSIWFPQDRTLLPVVGEPLGQMPDPRPAHLGVAPLIESAGADLNVEHGVVTGEVRGLEVCRVVDEPTVGRLTDEHGTPLAQGEPTALPDGDEGVILEVGVGANDREAFQLIHGHLPKNEALAEVVRTVAEHRAPGAPAHPLNRMAPERALRATAIDDPSSVGMASLAPMAPPVRRPSMKAVAPCVASGTTPGGEARALVFSSGVDLELAPFVADVVTMLETPTAPAPPVVVAVARRDHLPISSELLDLLDHPVSVIHLDAA